MQAGSSPTALRHGLRHHVEGASANGFAPVLDALDRVAVSAKTTALIDLARRSREKKIVFTRFRATLDELARALNAAGFRVAIFHGGLTAAEKASAIADFEANAEILLSSEIGGEGRNLQFCRTVVNYDLPWNPTTIEQRVGRVHRIGQTREVFVFNFCLAGSVEERVLAILHDKINLFELVAGEMEMILGHLDAEHDFATLVMDAWARSQSTESEEQAFAELSDAITSARTRYQQTSEIDRTLFSEDYEV
jgi:SNF2 family DNA or RNA helicase